jgi:NAD(P)H-quinone oxidoreductase subunit I
MFNFFKEIGGNPKETVQAARYIGQGMTVTFDVMRGRSVTVQYPYENRSF